MTLYQKRNVFTARYELDFIYPKTVQGRDSSVGIATRYGLDGPGIESFGGWGTRFSAPV
jgi:hypothetical protein